MYRNRLARAGALARLAAPVVLVALVAAGWLVLSPLARSSALAADPASSSTIVSLGPVWAAVQPYIVELASALVTLFVAVIASQLKRWTGMELEANARAALHSALQSGVDRAIGSLGSAASDLSVDMRSAVVAQAVTWATASVPDAIRRLGATPEVLAGLAEAKLGAAIVSTATSVGAAPLPVAVPPGWVAPASAVLSKVAPSLPST